MTLTRALFLLAHLDRGLQHPQTFDADNADAYDRAMDEALG
jgi:hypothetical protein